MDTLTPQQRHTVMSRIHGKNTVPEKQIRSALHRAGFRYRICDKRRPGTPDMVLPRYYAVIFVHGCFWHAHDHCGIFRFPKSNQLFWIKKFIRNKKRDRAIISQYRAQCWRVCVVWECAIRGKKSKQKIDNVSKEIILWLEESNEPYLELRRPIQP
ncbi:MAG: DNA mismatch endonuclease Vsr [Treponema sp.]|nr:DNA mismatch endonuclease Vsr [Treponema sp.]